MKASALLKKQHRKVEETFGKLEKGKGDLSALLTSLANDLAAHMTIEETIFYPSVRSIDPDLVGESYEEHAMAQLALKRLLSVTTDDTTFKAKVTALKELIEHHVEEEEDELFPEVDEKVEADRLEQLGTEMLAAFEEAAERGYQDLLPAGLEASGDAANGSMNSSGRSGKRPAGRRPARSAE